MRTADLSPAVPGLGPGTRDSSTSDRPGAQREWHPRHRSRVTDQSHDGDRHIKEKPSRFTTSTPRCSPLLVHAPSAFRRGAQSRELKGGVSSGPKRGRDGCGRRLILTLGEYWPLGWVIGRIRGSWNSTLCSPPLSPGSTPTKPACTDGISRPSRTRGGEADDAEDRAQAPDVADAPHTPRPQDALLFPLTRHARPTHWVL